MCEGEADDGNVGREEYSFHYTTILGNYDVLGN